MRNRASRFLRPCPSLAALAIELLYVINVLAFIGFDVDSAVEVATDNKGAYDLCHRFTTSQHSRHIDRKNFKMRLQIEKAVSSGPSQITCGARQRNGRKNVGSRATAVSSMRAHL